MDVSLLLQPAIERSRSMLLYAQRLAHHAPPETRLELVRLPDWGGRVPRQLVDVLVPPLHVPRVSGSIAHVVDHAHAGFLRFLRIPGLVTVHDLIPLKAIRDLYPGEVRPHMSRRAGTWFRWNIGALKRAALLVAPSKATADEIGRLVGKLRVEVVPHGIDREFLEPPEGTALERVRERLGELAGRKIVLQVTNGFFYKNEIGFARTFSALSERFDDVAWIRVGAPLADDLEPRPAAGRFLHYSHAGVDELVALYHLAAVLLFPSWDEGFGWPPLEAMACGCPVVASDRGALAETAAPGALVADPGDPDEMARRVGDILNNGDLAAELIERGANHASRYRWPDAARRMAELYGEAARCA